MRALIRRDLKLAFRSGSGVVLGLAFYLVLATIYPLAIGNDAVLLARTAPATLWIGALLAMLLSFDRVFALDVEDGSLDVLLTSDRAPLSIAFAKTLVLWLTSGLPVLIVAPALALVLGYPMNIWLIPTLAVGTAGLAALGTFGAALVQSLKRGALILPILVLPLTVPSVIFGTITLKRAAEGGDVVSAFAILAGLTLATIALVPLAAARALSSD
ncbi:MAG: heme exporter protein CcmB [Deltaproteobacteria bacterium]